MVTAWTHLLPIGSRMHGRVLDAACGNGDYSRFLRQQGCDVVALDIQAIDSHHHGIRFVDNVPRCPYVQADVQALPFRDAVFDGVLCWDALQNVRDAPLCLREFRRVLRLGGLMTVRTVIKRNIPWVIPGVTPERGSSGVEFINWTIWNEEDLIYHAEQAGFVTIDLHCDPWNHMTYFGEVPA